MQCTSGHAWMRQRRLCAEEKAMANALAERLQIRAKQSHKIFLDVQAGRSRLDKDRAIRSMHH
jgi:hypothetical protein